MRPFVSWLSAALLLILAGIAVPYGLMSGPPHGLGILSFWTAFGGAVIGLILWGVRGWGR